MPAVTGEEHEQQGVRYVDIRVGTGDTPVTPGRCVFVHYTGWLANGGTLFESSRDTVPGTPVRPVGFVQGTRAVIDGWESGVAGMRAGGIRRLYVPQRLAYGDEGHRPRIPPRSNLVFDLEVVTVTAALRAPRGAQVCPPWTEVGG